MSNIGWVPSSTALTTAYFCIFDLIELNGDDLRRDSLEVRKATLASMPVKAGPGMRFNEHIEGDGPTLFARACKMGLAVSSWVPPALAYSRAT